MDDENLKSIGKMVIDVMISNGDEISRILAAQLQQAKLRIRGLSPVGWFIDFDLVNNNEVLTCEGNFHINADACVEGMEMGIAFILFVVEGKISMLEAVTYGDERLPCEIKILSIDMFPESNSCP